MSGKLIKNSSRICIPNIDESKGEATNLIVIILSKVLCLTVFNMTRGGGVDEDI